MRLFAEMVFNSKASIIRNEDINHSINRGEETTSQPDVTKLLTLVPML